MTVRSLTCAMALMLGMAGAAQAQNILILTTGSLNSGNQPENTFLRGVISEFGAPLTVGTCGPTPQTVTDPVSGLSKTVTCNATELVNGTALDPNVLFAPGYDLVVVASAYTTIDAADWAPLQTAIAARRMRGTVLFIDTVNAANANQVRPLLQASLNNPSPALVNGAAVTSINNHALNTAATGAGDFAGTLDSFRMGQGYFPYNNVPAANALFLWTGAGPVSTGTTAAAGVLVPSVTSFNGRGACIFGANDIGWANPDAPTAGWTANAGRVGTAFLRSFNNPTGPCAAAIAAPPVLDIAKATTFGTHALPFNGSTVPYTVTVTNPSSSMAIGVALTDNAPAGMTFGAWLCTVLNPGTGQASTCPTPLPSGNLSTSLTLSAGAQLQFTVNATVVDNQLALTNTATLGLPVGTTCTGDRTPCDASVAFAPLPAELDIAKQTSAGTNVLPANGSTVPYTITVSNPSSGAASNVDLNDPAPSGMSFDTWSCAVLNAGTGQPSVCPASLGSGNLATQVNLSAGAQLQFTVDAIVVDNQLALTNVATLNLPAGATCVGGRTPCDARVAFSPPPVAVAPQPVPGLGALGLSVLGGMLGALGMRGRRRVA